ncbi:MAG: DUF262 domain-containing protein [Bacteroidia bacterium]
MDLKSIHEIFTNRILRIPSYQRGYSWSNNKAIFDTQKEEKKNIKGQLIDLWNDIINIPENSWHYTGLLTLGEVKQRNYEWLPNHKQYAIVDGQQRITSILILITAIIEEANSLGLKLGVRDDDVIYQYLYINSENLYAYIFGYDQDNPSDKYFRRHVLKLDEVEDDSKESLYTENLKNAKAFFTFKVQEFVKNDTARLKNLFNKVTGSLKLNEYILPSELDEYVVFETMNNRGRPLSELEKLKNRLMYLVDKLQITCLKDADDKVLLALKDDLIKKINTAWISIYQSLGADKLDPLDDESFIKNHWIMYFEGYNRTESSVYANFLFNEYFTIERIYGGDLKPEVISAYVKSLQESSVIWNNIHHAVFFPTEDENIKNMVLGLHRVGFRASFKPLALAILNRKNDSSYLEIIPLLEFYAFKIFYISFCKANTGDSKLFIIAYKVYRNQITAEAAVNEIKSHMDYYYSFSAFTNQIHELFKSGEKKGYYNWPGLKYFLFKYDSKLRSLNNNTTDASELNWKDFQNKDSIEHIYPQSAAKSLSAYCEGNETQERIETYNKLQKNWESFAGYSDEERMRLCGSLGNLLAISISDNASFSNDPFKFKVDQSNKGGNYKNRGYRFDSMSAQIVAKQLDWTPESIINRGILMINSIVDLLGEKADLLAYNDKLKLLGLEFMIKSDVSDGIGYD